MAQKRGYLVFPSSRPITPQSQLVIIKAWALLRIPFFFPKIPTPSHNPRPDLPTFTFFKQTVHTNLLSLTLGTLLLHFVIADPFT